MASLILTLVGPDRPGLVNRVSEAVASLGGSWQESRMAHLAGQFAGIVLVDVPEAQVESLTARLAGGEAGLDVTVHWAGQSPVIAAEIVALELVCQDRPGIIREISTVLTAQGVNIEELTTHILSGSFSGEPMFRANARLLLPAGTTTGALRAALEALGNDLMVDLRLGEAP